MPLSPTMPIMNRVAMIEDALARVLHRDSVLRVEATTSQGDRAVIVVVDGPASVVVHHYDLYALARELEVLL